MKTRFRIKPLVLRLTGLTDVEFARTLDELLTANDGQSIISTQLMSTHFSDAKAVPTLVSDWVVVMNYRQAEFDT